MQVQMLEYNAIAQIVKKGAGKCQVCLHMLDEPSLNYTLNARKGHPGLSVVTGQCGCTFHLDCCSTWLQRHNNCPTCSSQWVQCKIASVEPSPNGDDGDVGPNNFAEAEAAAK